MCIFIREFGLRSICIFVVCVCVRIYKMAVCSNPSWRRASAACSNANVIFDGPGDDMAANSLQRCSRAVQVVRLSSAPHANCRCRRTAPLHLRPSSKFDESALRKHRICRARARTETADDADGNGDRC